MDSDMKCDEITFESSSSNTLNGINLSCDKILKESKKVVKKCDQENFMSTSSSSSMSSGLMAQNYCAIKEHVVKAPNISYEVALAKSIMQEHSSISGDNLFDHLSDIIKRVIDERPPNVIDFFEEFSRSVREQKFHLPERFPPDAVFQEKRIYKVARKQLISMKLPYPTNWMLQDEDDIEEENEKQDELKIELYQERCAKFLTFNNRVQHLQFFWNQCGFGISPEDIFQLACAMDRLQTHPSITQCRFWGMVNGLKASYYIIEANLTNEECESRLVQMEKEMQESHKSGTEEKASSHIGPELTPGAVGWENYPEEEIKKMKRPMLPVPTVKTIEHYDIPPEPIGKGVNRYSYFVVNSLFDEWIELPIATPKQISVARDIKKFFTGDLEESIVSYPIFCGKEKHYLRAMIARITAGTYVAPSNFYRKMTKSEKLLFDGTDLDGEDDDEEEEEPNMDEDDEDADNDIVLLKNEKYNDSTPLNTLIKPDNWVHVRPNILLQGRVVWYNEAKAACEREKERKRLEKIQLGEMSEYESENEDDDDDEEDEGEEEEMDMQSEKGPAILTPCLCDTYSDTPEPWTGRFNSKFTNEYERIVLMQSNIWPGAYSFVYKDFCESIYLGWGQKFVSRNMVWKHLPCIEDECEHKSDNFLETTDPSVEMEEEYRMNLLKKQMKFTQFDQYDEQISEDSGDGREDEDGDDEE